MEVATLPRAGARVPERTYKQRRDALIEANRIRTHRARLKRDLAAGRVSLEAVLDDPDCATMKVFEALVCLPKIGRVKANRIVTRARISPSKTCGGLSVRQRRELVGLSSR